MAKTLLPQSSETVEESSEEFKLTSRESRLVMGVTEALAERFGAHRSRFYVEVNRHEVEELVIEQVSDGSEIEDAIEREVEEAVEESIDELIDEIAEDGGISTEEVEELKAAVREEGDQV